jgi:hypothetical protein
MRMEDSHIPNMASNMMVQILKKVVKAQEAT